MGEWKVQVPVKVEGWTAERMDRDVERFPFCEGRSSIARKLIELAYAAIDAGIIEFEPGTLQEVLSNLRVQKRPSPQKFQSVPSVPGVRAEDAPFADLRRSGKAKR